MSTEAADPLPLVMCPGCQEPMHPKEAVLATRELDDVTYVCPNCGAETTRTMKRT